MCLVCFSGCGFGCRVFEVVRYISMIKFWSIMSCCFILCCFVLLGL